MALKEEGGAATDGTALADEARRGGGCAEVGLDAGRLSAALLLAGGTILLTAVGGVKRLKAGLAWNTGNPDDEDDAGVVTPGDEGLT